MEFEKNLISGSFLNNEDFLSQFLCYCKAQNFNNTVREIERAQKLNKISLHIASGLVKCEKANLLEIRSINKQNIKKLYRIAHEMILN